MTTDGERLARIEQMVETIGRDVGRLVSLDRYEAEHRALTEGLRTAEAKADKAADDSKTTRRLILASFLLPILVYLVQTMSSPGAG